VSRRPDNAPAFGPSARLWRRVPGFARIAGYISAFISRHRGVLAWTGRLWRGGEREPPRYELTRWLFLRLFGLICLSAFISLGVQIIGLIGGDGILPLDRFLENTGGHLGAGAWLKLPTLFWLHPGDQALFGTCMAGSVFALLLTLNVLPRTSLLMLYLLFLSLFYAGQTFMVFQWDLLLLEVGFLAMFLPGRSAIIVWLYRWLAFRFMFLSGVVKIASRDPSWDKLTALTYHFETQPLPTPLAWFAHHLPEPVLVSLAGATLVIELVIPFLIFLPRKLRHVAGFCFIALQAGILLTGNYNFFNLLTIAFCLFLFDDAALRRLTPAPLVRQLDRAGTGVQVPVVNTLVAAFVAALILTVNYGQFRKIFTGAQSALLTPLYEIVIPLRVTSIYGPFAVMTTRRIEIIVEGSADKKDWKPYEFRYKPGDLYRRPPWNIPHQPRLDWQMWFAAHDARDRPPWFGRLLQRLLEGEESVTALLLHNPFPEAPPRYVRALAYHYRFTDKTLRATTGQWWQRELIGIYYPAVELSGD